MKDESDAFYWKLFLSFIRLLIHRLAWQTDSHNKRLRHLPFSFGALWRPNAWSGRQGRWNGVEMKPSFGKLIIGWRGQLINMFNGTMAYSIYSEDDRPLMKLTKPLLPSWPADDLRFPAAVNESSLQNCCSVLKGWPPAARRFHRYPITFNWFTPDFVLFVEVNWFPLTPECLKIA